MNKLRYCILLLFCTCFYAQGQNFREQYESFKRQSIKKYVSFREECNKAYADNLRKAWEAYNTLPEIPKPKEEDVPPIIYNEEETITPIHENEIPIHDTIPVPTPTPQPKPIEPIPEVSPIINDSFSFPYYNTELSIRAGENHKFKIGNLSGENLANAWEHLSNDTYNSILSDCLRIRSEYALCDWAYFQMLHAFSVAFLGESNESTFLTAFLYCQSGYKMRLAIANDNLGVLYGSNHIIYNSPYYVIDDDYYYPFRIDDEEIHVANSAFPNESGMSLVMYQTPKFSIKESDDKHRVSQYQLIDITYKVNENLIAFYNDYPNSQIGDDPLTRWAIYANTEIDPSLSNLIYPKIRQAIAGKSELQSVNIILNFVQTAFEYEYDDKVWGGDRAFFTEESIYYPYCDCEDRSILFSRIIRDILDLDVILVYYPGHLAAAVEFGTPVKGDYINLNSRKFIICDPTYIGAPVGITMPDMNNNEAKVILLKR